MKTIVTMTRITLGLILATTCLMPQRSQAAAVAHYTFDSDFADSSGNGNDGSASGGGATITASQSVFGGGAANFTTARNWVDLTTMISFTDGTPYTLSFWARPTTTQRSMVMGKVNSTASFVWLKHNSNLVRIENTARDHLDFGGLPAYGDWNHYAIVVEDTDGDTLVDDMNVYINKVKQTTLNDINTSIDINAIGEAYNTDYTFDFVGQIDEVWIFDEALDATAVTNLYTYNATNTPPLTANNDTATTSAGTPTNVYVLANDSGDGRGIASIVDTGATNSNGEAMGTASYEAPNDYITFTDNGTYGDALFSYVVTNAQGSATGQVTVTVNEAPMAGVLAHYAFDGDYNDTSGHGNHSTAQGASVSINTTTNVFGSGCANFTSAREWVTIPLQSFAIGEPFTLSFWARPTADRQSMVMGEANTQDSLVWLKHNSSELRFFNDAGANYNFSDLPGVNSWNHYVLVAGDLDGDGDELDLCAYINTVKKTTINDIQTHMKINAIGDAYDSSSWDFNGQIDEVWIFDHAVDQNDVDSLYESNSLFVPSGSIFSFK